MGPGRSIRHAADQISCNDILELILIHLPGRWGWYARRRRDLRWPQADVRLEMLQEAIEVIRALWTGNVTHDHGRYYKVEQARLSSLPDSPPPILVAAKVERAIEIAARNDGLVGTVPDPDPRGPWLLKALFKAVQGRPRHADWACIRSIRVLPHTDRCACRDLPCAAPAR